MIYYSVFSTVYRSRTEAIRDAFRRHQDFKNQMHPLEWVSPSSLVEEISLDTASVDFCPVAGENDPELLRAVERYYSMYEML